MRIIRFLRLCRCDCFIKFQQYSRVFKLIRFVIFINRVFYRLQQILSLFSLNFKLLFQCSNFPCCIRIYIIFFEQFDSIFQTNESFIHCYILFSNFCQQFMIRLYANVFINLIIASFKSFYDADTVLIDMTEFVFIQHKCMILYRIILIQKSQIMMETNQYTEICQIGEGAFGRVYKALTHDNRIVAIKQIKFDNDEEGIPSTALRQISLLKSLKNHENIVPLLEIIYKPKQKNLKMVFDYYDFDLKKYNQSKKQPLPEFQIKSIIKQILNGLSYCHSRKVLHRDLKPQNILIDNKGNVKLADFGLGRVLMIPQKTLTHQVETLWYRAPQILLGQKKYTFAVDIWAVGCIFAQLALKKPLFLGNGYEIEQIFTIFQILGTPCQGQWPNIVNLPDFKATFPKWKKVSLQQKVPAFSPKAIDLLNKMLQFNPDNRITAQQALQHEYLMDV